MFNLAVEDDKLSSVPSFRMPERVRPAPGTFRTVQRAFGCVARVSSIAPRSRWFTGMRFGEVTRLKWDQVDFMTNTIGLRVGETKNDSGRDIPIIPQLRDLLLEQRLRRQPDCPYECFRLDRRGQAARLGGFRKAWRSRCVKFGLGRMEPVPDSGTGEALYDPRRKDCRSSKSNMKMVYRGMIFHDLRRSAVRNQVRSTVPERVAREITGTRREACLTATTSSPRMTLRKWDENSRVFERTVTKRGRRCTKMQQPDPQ
jgi:integrase